VVHVAAGIKDVDLVLKRDARIAALRPEPLVLADVPASFVLLPDDLAARAAFLLASPPLPPSGAYRFGGRRIVGLARREESPDLDEVVRRLPQIAFMVVESVPGGGFRFRDRTAEVVHNDRDHDAARR